MGKVLRILPARGKDGAPSGQADTYPLSPDQWMGHTGSTHASKMDTDGLTRTAPAHAQTKESREKVAVEV